MLSTNDQAVKDNSESFEDSSIDEPEIYEIPKMENTSNKASLRLICASIVCFILMIIEVIGGLWANSLAILTDAAHMFSDISGFIISIFALWIAKKPSTSRLSYGYHRAEVVGAMLSIAIIWVLTIWLVIEAISRIFGEPYEIDETVMLGTSIFGLICNLIIMKILHGGHIEHGIGHHHVCESDNNIHNHDDNTKKHDNHKHNHHHHSHHDNHDHKIIEKKDCDHIDNKVKHDDCSNQKHEHNDSNCAYDNSHQNHNNSDNYENQGHQNHDNSDNYENQLKTKEIKLKTNNQSSSCSYNEFNDEIENNEIAINYKTSPTGKKTNKNLSVISEKDHYNLRAAMMHIIGDIAQSIGVILAAIIIFFYPNLKVADPICTFFFAIIVIFTTYNVIKDCLAVIMEGVPLGIHLPEFEEKLKNIEDVVEVHDLHIWALTIGKPALSAHILSKNTENSLRKATKLCRNYGIYHSTIQVENWHNKNDPKFIRCKQNIHSMNRIDLEA